MMRFLKDRALRPQALLLVALTLLASSVNSCGPASSVAEAVEDPLALTQEAETLFQGGRQRRAEGIVFRLLREHGNHVLKPYWVYQLAQVDAQSDRLDNYLRRDDALWPHYYWWKAMKRPPGSCGDEFAQYARLAHQSSVMPVIPESTEIQKRLNCAEKLPEAQRLVLAEILDQHRYFWLIPRLVKKVSSPRGLMLQGESRLLLRQYAAASSSFATLTKQKASTTAQKKEALIQAGVAERKRRRYAQAHRWWSNISAQDRQYYPEVLWHKAMLAYDGNQSGQGENLLTQLIQKFPQHERVPEALEHLLRRAQSRRDFKAMMRLGAQLVKDWPEHTESNAARYWLGRSLEQQGYGQDARDWYRKQSQVGPLNNYYTQLSACRLKGVDCFQPRYIPLQAQPPRLEFLDPLPELKTLAEQNRTDVLQIVAPFAPIKESQRKHLMSYALRYNGNYFRSIRLIWQEESRDPDVLRLMYPLHYDALQKENAKRYNLPQSLIAGLTWQESMYKADIRSPSGAIGLMQLMPSTAKGISRSAGLPGLSISQLTQPKINIRLGSYYLNEQLRRWNGNLLPMIASYNAGPGAVGRWVRSFGHVNKDEFVEKIPYDETRRYVKMVLTHSRVYEAVYGPDAERRR